ncbi:MAG: (Fe-S)-binding protein [bacterium]|jgi:Fe-S oxidoreductase
MAEVTGSEPARAEGAECAEARVAEIASLIKDTRAYLCIDCSKCTGSCPIGKAGSVYSPRLLVQHLMLDGRDPSETDLWRCLTCGLCRERCPSDVDFPKFISRLRATALVDGKLPQTTHGGTLQELMRIQASRHLKQNKMDWLPDWVNARRADDLDGTAEDVYFVGCAPYFDVVFADFDLDLKGTHQAALELLKATGLNPVVLADERCCGHDALWSGDEELFRKLAGRNLELFKAAGVKRLFVSCPEGYHTFAREYPAHLGDLGFEVINTVRYLAENPPPGFTPVDAAKAGTLSRADREALKAKKTPPEPCEVTYHDSCRMGRFSGIYDEPRKMLAMTRGVTLKEMGFNRGQASCCGSNLWINCDSLSRRMQMDLLEEARKTGAGVMLTACDKCRIHLACALLQNGHVSDGLKTDNILRFLYRKGVRKS